MEKWCWAASARMFADLDDGSANNVPDSRKQENAVEEIKGSVEDEGGNLLDALCAARYYETGSGFAADRDFTKRDQVVLTEAALRRSLDDGYIIYIARVHLAEFDNVASGHATVIGGYTSCVVGNTLYYQYIIFDPWPANEPDPWLTTPQETTGQTYTASYQWLCNGQRFLSSDKGRDNMHWWGFITEETDYIYDTVAAE